MQILHHAYVCNVRYVCLLIGDKNANILAGIWVHFDDSLKRAWENVLVDMHGLSVGMFYSPIRKPFKPNKQQEKLLKPVLSEIRVNKAPLDLYSFVQNIRVWQELCLWMPHPLPPVANILPLIFSEWNAGKGGSDTRSKDVWNVLYKPPVKHPQAHAVARLIVLCTTALHGLFHVGNSKSNSKKSYKSARHYGNAASQRGTLRQSYFDLVRVLMPSVVQNTGAIMTPTKDTEVVGRSTRTSAPALAVELSSVPKIGKTPSRNIMTQISNMKENIESISIPKKMIVS